MRLPRLQSTGLVQVIIDAIRSSRKCPPPRIARRALARSVSLILAMLTAFAAPAFNPTSPCTNPKKGWIDGRLSPEFRGLRTEREMIEELILDEGLDLTEVLADLGETTTPMMLGEEERETLAVILEQRCVDSARWTPGPGFEVSTTLYEAPPVVEGLCGSATEEERRAHALAVVRNTFNPTLVGDSEDDRLHETFRDFNNSTCRCETDPTVVTDIASVFSNPGHPHIEIDEYPDWDKRAPGTIKFRVVDTWSGSEPGKKDPDVEKTVAVSVVPPCTPTELETLWDIPRIVVEKDEHGNVVSHVIGVEIRVCADDSDTRVRGCWVQESVYRLGQCSCESLRITKESVPIDGPQSPTPGMPCYGDDLGADAIYLWDLGNTEAFTCQVQVIQHLRFACDPIPRLPEGEQHPIGQYHTIEVVGMLTISGDPYSPPDERRVCVEIDHLSDSLPPTCAMVQTPGRCPAQ